jgi:hypothetical protein
MLSRPGRIVVDSAMTDEADGQEILQKFGSEPAAHVVDVRGENFRANLATRVSLQVRRSMLFIDRFPQAPFRAAVL